MIHQTIEEEDIQAVVDALRSPRITQGPLVERFERALTKRHAIAVSSGTAALQIVYMGLGARKVLVPANTFVATASAARLAGAEVEFIDINEEGNIDPDLLEARLLEGDFPDVVTVVHFAGLPCDMARILELQETYGFRIVEDAAHALGSMWLAHNQWWSPGEHPRVAAACFSFHPTKAITTGEGGAIVTEEAILADRFRSLREHGMNEGRQVVRLGLNARMSELQAALGLSQMRKLNRFLEERAQIAGHYIAELDLEPIDVTSRLHAWHLFPMRFERRDRVRHKLQARGFETQVHYQPVHHHPYFDSDVFLPEAERHGRHSLSLPIYPGFDPTPVIKILKR